MHTLNTILLNELASKYALKAEVIHEPSPTFNCPFCDIPTYCINIEHKEFEWGSIHVNLHTFFNPFPSVFIPADKAETGFNGGNGQHLQLSLITQTIAFLKDVQNAEDTLFVEPK